MSDVLNPVFRCNVLTTYFNHQVNQCSPVQEDLIRVVDVDETGQEHVSFKSVDYPELQKSLGYVSDWSLQNLLKAGINPDFPVHTTFTTRLQAEQYLDSVREQIETLFPVESPVVEGEDKDS